MPVKIKISNEKLSTLVESAVAEKFVSAGIQLIVSYEHLSFLQDGEIVKEVKFSPVVLTLFKQGVLGDTQKASFMETLETLLQSITESGPTQAEVEAAIDQVVEDTKVEKAKVSIPKSKVTKTKTGSYVGKFHNSPSVDVLMTQTPMPLRNAVHMYQAVKGTGESSRYFLIALSDQYAVAARCRSGKVSIRLESRSDDPIPSEIGKTLEQAGFDNHGGKYASVHLEATNQTWARKILGALLLGTGIEFKTPLPRVEKIYGKGS